MHNSNSMWKSLKLLLPRKLKSVAKSYIINDVLETNPKAIAADFNDFFVSVCESLMEAFVYLFSNIEYQNILAIKFQKLNHHRF